MSGLPKNLNVLQELAELKRLFREHIRDTRQNVAIVEDGKIYLDGDTKDVYITWDSATSQLRFYVGGSLVGYLDSTNTGTKLQNT